jgi:4-hydroxybenzoate polyprenyltransferase
LSSPSAKPPLCVELETALLATRLDAEQVAHTLALDPGRGLWLATTSLLRGPAQPANVEGLDVTGLPRRTEVEALAALARAEGRRTVLVGPAPWSEAVAGAVGHFDEVLTLPPDERARGLTARFGEKGFTWVAAGDASLPVWRAAASAVVVGDEALRARAASATRVEAHLAVRTAGFRVWRRALRIHQWLKNLLVFAPAMAAHAFEPALLLKAVGAFVAFSLCASSVYLTNDLADLASDRAHRTKRERPLAAGKLSIAAALRAVPLLLLAALLLGLWVGPAFALQLGLYLAATVAYTFVFKRWAILDVLLLAGLYVQRLVAGAAATSVPISPWFGAFAMFLFLGLALVKRAAELKGSGGSRNPRRGYRSDDLPVVMQLGVASSFAAVVVLALYLQSSGVATLYGAPLRLWALCPLALYWQARLWLLTGRGEMSDDPVLFAARDRVSHGVLLLGLAVVGLSI